MRVWWSSYGARGPGAADGGASPVSAIDVGGRLNRPASRAYTAITGRSNARAAATIRLS